MLVDRSGCHGRDSGVVLIDSQGNGAPAQEDPSQSLPADGFRVRVWSRLLPMQLQPPLFSSLNSKGNFWW
jgi:hypothetical protein